MKKHYSNPIIDLSLLSEKDVLDVSIPATDEVLIEDSLWSTGGAGWHAVLKTS